MMLALVLPLLLSLIVLAPLLPLLPLPLLLPRSPTAWPDVSWTSPDASACSSCARAATVFTRAPYVVDYAHYHDLDAAHQHLLVLANSSPFVRLYSSSQTTANGRRMYLIRFSDRASSPSSSSSLSSAESFPSSSSSASSSSSSTATMQRINSEKLKVLFTFAEHPRELITIESCIYLLENLTSYAVSSSTAPSLWSRFIATHLDLHLVCIFNPDGVRLQEAEHPAASPSSLVAALQSRSTRSSSSNAATSLSASASVSHPASHSPYCQRHNARGVDLNRNSDWQFGGPGSAAALGQEEYRGESAWSESESRFFLSLVMLFPYHFYLSIHSGEQQLLTPYVDTESRRLRRTRSPIRLQAGDARLIASVLEADRHRLPGEAQQSRAAGGYLRADASGIGYEKNSYSADGTYYDWIAARLHIPYAACLESFGDANSPVYFPSECFTQFNPAPSRLQSTLHSIHSVLIDTLLHVIHERFEVDYNKWLIGDIANVHEDLSFFSQMSPSSSSQTSRTAILEWQADALDTNSSNAQQIETIDAPSLHGASMLALLEKLEVQLMRSAYLLSNA